MRGERSGGYAEGTGREERAGVGRVFGHRTPASRKTTLLGVWTPL